MRLVLLFIILILCPVLVSAQNGNLVKDTLISEPNNLSYIHRKTTIHIGPSIPNYHINYVGKLSSGTLDSTQFFYEINISKGPNNKPFQTIEDTVDYIMTGLGQNFGRFPDINFDGYSDLPLKRNDDTYEFWLFDEHSGKFFKNEAFSGLHNPIIHSTEKKIIVDLNRSDSRQIFSVYNVVNQKLKLDLRKTTYIRVIDSVKNKIRIEEQFKNGKVDTVKKDTSRVN